MPGTQHTVTSLPPDDLTPDEVALCFPEQLDPLEGGVFEIALVLAGTASAGAYTAGVLDYLIEALDAWEAERGKPGVPAHRVVISSATGTSGGAINGAILARAARYAFPHGPCSGNPFYDTWIGAAGLEHFLATPENESTLEALLSTQRIEQVASRLLTFEGQPLQRPYLANPFRLCMTLGNLTGIPYSVRFAGTDDFRHGMTAHADHVRFSLALEGGHPNRDDPRRDQFSLKHGDPANWQQLRAGALATSAFPGAFKARPIERPLDFLRYRAMAVPREGGGIDVRPLVPDWDVLATDGKLPHLVKTANVDGGAFNNEPIDFGHAMLAGLAGRNPRTADLVTRALVLIDPFSNGQTLGAARPGNLLKTLGALVGAEIAQARFKPSDVALAGDESTFSRFLLAPVGPSELSPREIGSAAITASGLDGFLAFVHPDLSRHDFELGRYNAHRFLRSHFALPFGVANAGITNWEANTEDGACFEDDGAKWRRLVYLTPALLKNPPPPPERPSIPLPEAETKKAIHARLSHVVELAEDLAGLNDTLKGQLLGAYLSPVKWIGETKVVDAAYEMIRTALDERMLLLET
ncbi:patatin-like phospholipase family protein [Zavarzinia sp.]|uniref:patatin-like phospholipase family protein n=1 Tax=Zavarzinia sp. TaxID=2027920 RepID=UPI0035648431